MIEEQLLQYGVAGLFILYLIYDRQILLRHLTKAINELTTALSNMKGGRK